MASKVTLGNELLFPSDYLAAVEFKGRDVTLTIVKVFKDELKMRGGKSELKPVLSFRETKKKLVLNKTNADSIAEMYGTEATEWVGKRVTFYPTKTQCGRETVDCVRVREVVPQGKPQPTQPARQPDPEPGDGFGEPATNTPFDDATGEPTAIEAAAILYSERHGVVLPAAHDRLEEYANAVFGIDTGDMTDEQAADVLAKVKSGEIAPKAPAKKK